ncbi:MAG: hypothetical protein J1E39_07810 [Eubacterium sp.]|nr:hypothetical protein [Eubacterium sp.]
MPKIILNRNPTTIYGIFIRFVFSIVDAMPIQIQDVIADIRMTASATASDISICSKLSHNRFATLFASGSNPKGTVAITHLILFA